MKWNGFKETIVFLGQKVVQVLPVVLTFHNIYSLDILIIVLQNIHLPGVLNLFLVEYFMDFYFILKVL